MASGIRHGTLDEIDDNEADFEFLSPSQFVSSNVNAIPFQNAVQSPRLFYGARFIPQAQPLQNPEAPWVQNLDPLDKEGRSFDEKFGKLAGALRADDDGVVEDATDDNITLRTATGLKQIPLYRTHPYNRKSGLHQQHALKKGDAITKGQLLARSNYTDADGTLALGANARVGLLADRGHSMDDAVVISRAFGDRLTSDHMETYEQEWDDHTRGGREHHQSLFPKKYTLEQLKNIDDDGFVKQGTILQPGDPIALATQPRTISSATAALGSLSRSVRVARRDASQIWDESVPGEVTDVVQTKHGKKAVIRSYRPAKEGDKVVFRSGAKGTLSKIIPNDRMPRTADGQPLDVMSNHLGLVSRANAALPFELIAGKVAAHLGKPIKLPGFNKPDESWVDMIEKMAADNGIQSEEKVFDPESGKWLRNPVTVGNGYILKLHHTSASKASSRGTAGYDAEQQPMRGGSSGGNAKRLSGLETHALLSSGAYATIREGATLRGQRNDAYWRSLRQGQSPKPPGRPFVWDKFLAMLQGTGMMARDLGEGKLRLGPFTDNDLTKHEPIEVRNGNTIDLRTMEPAPGGLFDPSLAAANKWGQISLPTGLPNPAFEESIRALTGLTKKEFQAILAGEAEMPAHLRGGKLIEA